MSGPGQKPGVSAGGGALNAAALLARVRDYPYLPAAECFALGAQPPADAPEVIAFGANADSTVLAAKLGAGAAVRGRPARLADHDVAFSAHVSPYGAIPATLVPSPGTSVVVHVLCLASADLRRLDATEPNYVRETLTPGVEAYRSRHGALICDGAPVALAAVPATGRTLPALTQTALQEHLRVALDLTADPDAFVLAGVRDPRVRARRTAWLRRRSAFSFGPLKFGPTATLLAARHGDDEARHEPADCP